MEIAFKEEEPGSVNVKGDAETVYAQLAIGGNCVLLQGKGKREEDKSSQGMYSDLEGGKLGQETEK